jgi:hypothetical protein
VPGLTTKGRRNGSASLRIFFFRKFSLSELMVPQLFAFSFLFFFPSSLLLFYSPSKSSLFQVALLISSLDYPRDFYTLTNAVAWVLSRKFVRILCGLLITLRAVGLTYIYSVGSVGHLPRGLHILDSIGCLLLVGLKTCPSVGSGLTSSCDLVHSGSSSEGCCSILHIQYTGALRDRGLCRTYYKNFTCHYSMCHPTQATSQPPKPSP